MSERALEALVQIRDSLDLAMAEPGYEKNPWIEWLYKTADDAIAEEDRERLLTPRQAPSETK